MSFKSTIKHLVVGLTALMVSALLGSFVAHAAHAGEVCPTVVAHRGVGAGGAAENTVEGVRTAPADWVEIDVQRTKDGVLVLQHDTSFARMTNVERVYPSLRPWYVKNLTWAQVKRLTVTGGARVPTLDQVLDAAQQAGKGVQVEAKAPKLYPWIGKAIDRELDAHASVPTQVITFDETFLRNYDRAYPGTETVWIHGKQIRQLDVRRMFDFVAVPIGAADAGYVSRAAAEGLGVQAYVPNTAAEARRAQDIGIVAFTSDHAETAASGLTNCGS